MFGAVAPDNQQYAPRWVMEEHRWVARKQGHAMPEPALHVVTTTEHEEDALTIGHLLIERRLAACVQVVGPVTSVFRWQGAVEQGQEWQCWIKTRAAKYGAVEAAIRQRHPYDEPEVIAMPITAGSQSYLKWLAEETA